jgi:hypothetical protein
MLPKYLPGLIESDDLSELHVSEFVTLAEALGVTTADCVGVLTGGVAVLALEPHPANRKTATTNMAATTMTRRVGL